MSVRKKYVCEERDHKPVITRVLSGGEGPDDAGWIVHCKVCDCFGWMYCDDGYIGWRPDEDAIVIPHRSFWWKVRAKWHHLRRRISVPLTMFARVPIRGSRGHKWIR